MNWISVKERLPEEGEDVLFFDFDIEIGQKMRSGWHPNWSDTLISFEQVSYWMPLPDPPEEEA